MQLSVWLYSHRFGTDVLYVLAEDGHEVTKAEVIAATQIDYEGDEREDEALEHDRTLPLDAAVLAQPDGIWKLPVVGTARTPEKDPAELTSSC